MALDRLIMVRFLDMAVRAPSEVGIPRGGFRTKGGWGEFVAGIGDLGANLAGLPEWVLGRNAVDGVCFGSGGQGDGTAKNGVVRALHPGVEAVTHIGEVGLAVGGQGQVGLFSGVEEQVVEFFGG